MKKLILFDFDGVIADSMPQILKNAKKACRIIDHPCSPSAEIINNLEKMEFIEFAKKLKIPEEKLDEFVNITLRLLHEEDEVPSIYHGMKSLINKLALNNTLCIVTGNTKNVVSAFLEKYKLAEPVSFIFDVYHKGSKADKILEAMVMYGIERPHVFMIGDATSDILAAKDAQVTSIAVSWGHQNISRLRELSPDFMVNSPEELLAVLQQ
jgi:phosphoglycolate phosphatase-like HAD superfamily hydrolase